MRKLILASAIAAVTLLSGNAFAISAGASKTIRASSATVKVDCGCYRPCHDHRHARCHGYYSLYTYVVPAMAAVAAVDVAMAVIPGDAVAFLAASSGGRRAQDGPATIPALSNLDWLGFKTTQTHLSVKSGPIRAAIKAPSQVCS